MGLDAFHKIKRTNLARVWKSMTENNKQDPGEASWRQALTAISLGWDLALPIFGGVLLGHLLDRWLGTGHIFTLGLLMLGIGVGYFNVARFIQRIDRKGREDVIQKETPNGEEVDE